jgi:hypothetical protein
MLDLNNLFVKKIRMARDRLTDHGNEEFIIRIVGAKEGDPVQYSMPTTDELAMLVVGDFSLDTFKCDIIIETHSNELKQISALHPTFMHCNILCFFHMANIDFRLGFFIME